MKGRRKTFERLPWSRGDIAVAVALAMVVGFFAGILFAFVIAGLS